MEKSKNSSGPIKPNKPGHHTSSVTDEETRSQGTIHPQQKTKKGNINHSVTNENAKPFSKDLEEDIPISNQDPWSE
jgi:hypothetical protein